MIRPHSRWLHAAVLFFAQGAACAQGYPEKTIFIVAPFPAGGSVDLVARAVAQRMSDTWKQLVVHPSIPARSVKELLALERSRPGTLKRRAGMPCSRRGRHRARSS